MRRQDLPPQLPSSTRPLHPPGSMEAYPEMRQEVVRQEAAWWAAAHLAVPA